MSLQKTNLFISVTAKWKHLHIIGEVIIIDFRQIEEFVE